EAIQRRFRLDSSGRGVSCDAGGLFLAGTALLEKVTDGTGLLRRRPRPARDLHRDLTMSLKATPTHLDQHGNYLTDFYVDPPSKVGGVIVQKIVSTDRVYGSVVSTTVGWEAWEVEAGSFGTGNMLADDTWKPPPAALRPSVATERTVVGEARFYEGITMRDL